MAVKNTKDGSTPRPTRAIIEALSSVNNKPRQLVLKTQHLLGLDIRPKSEELRLPVTVAPQPAVRSRTVVSKAKAKTSLASRLAKTPTHVEVYEEPSSTISASDRKVFAIEVINVTLQSLNSDQVRSRTVPRVRNGEQADGYQRQSTKNSTDPVASQLKPLSRNKVAPRARSAKDSGEKTFQKVADDRDETTETIIGCALAAFAYVRTEQLASDCKRSNNDWKLENGMLAFIARLLALQYFEIAKQELCNLKQTLDARISWSTSKAAGRSCRPELQSSETARSHETYEIVDLLHFAAIPDEESALSAMTNFQMLVLKALVQHDHRDVDDVLLARLELTSPSSPTNLLLALAERKTAKDSAARQLESTAQLIFALCPSVSTKHDEPEVTGQWTRSEGACLRLQTIAFKTQLRWMHCAGHTGDVDSEICRPFLRCLKAYNRRCTAKPSERYKTAGGCVKDLLQSLTKQSTNLKLGSSWTEVTHHLSKMAIEAGQPSDALDHLSSQHASNAQRDVRDGKQVAVLARVAVLKLASKQPQSNLGCIAELDDLIAMADQATGREASDLGILLNELLKVGQAILPFLSATAKSDSTSAQDIIQLFSFFERLIFLFDHFFAAISSHPELVTDAAMLKTRQKLEVSAYMTVKALVFVASIDHFVTIIGLPRLEQLLQMSALICASLRDASLEDAVELNANQSTVLAVSNAYWTLFNRLKSGGLHDAEAFRIARASCSCLSGQRASVMEAGQLSSKLLKLGLGFRKSGEMEAAHETLGMVIDCARQTGILEEIARLARSDTIATVLESYSRAATFSQALEALLQEDIISQDVDNEEKAFFDMHELDQESRCALLEIQVLLCTRSQKTRRRNDRCIRLQTSILSLLLELYDEDNFPIRRQWTASRLIWIALDHPDAVSDYSVARSFGCFSAFSDRDMKQDQKLTAISTHVQSSLSVATALLKNDKIKTRYEKAASIWTSVVQSCVSSSQLRNHVGDIEGFCSQLLLLADYLHLHAFYDIELRVLLTLLNIHELEGKDGRCAVESTRSRIGMLYLELDNTAKAGLHLLKNVDHSSNAIPPATTSAYCHAALAAYYHALSDGDKCAYHLDLALECEAQSSSRMPSETTARQKLVTYCINADLLSFRSYVLWDDKSKEEALELQARAMVILQRAWKSLENRDISKSAAEAKAEVTDVESVNYALSKLTINNESSRLGRRHTGPLYWILGPRLCKAFTQLSKMSYWSGLYEDCVHYAEQALEIAEAMQSEALLGSSLVRLSDLLCRSGAVDDSRQHLQRAGRIYDENHNSIDAIWHNMVLGQMHHLDGDWANELKAYQVAKEVTTRLLARSSSPGKADGATQASPTTLTRQQPSLRRDKVLTARPGSHSRTKATPATATNKTTTLRSPKVEFVARMLGRLVAEAHLAQGEVEKATAMLSDRSVQASNMELMLQNNSTLARAHILQGLSNIATDPAFSMLTESIVSIPSAVRQRRRGSSAVSVAAAPQTGVRVGKSKLAGSSPRKAGPSGDLKDDSPHFVKLFVQAYGLVAECSGKVIRQCSVNTLLQSSLASATAAMLVSFAFHDHLNVVTHSMQVAWSIEIPHIVTSARERAYIDLEQKKSTSKLTTEVTSSAEHLTPDADLSLSHFQSNFIDIIPSNWTTISMYLDERREHMYITRYEAERAPFVLRLPLSRENAEDPDEVTFTFDDAKEELHAIIDASDATVHAARDDVEEMKQKGAKSKWWSDREALNDRLKDLLLNMENMWFGGFRGVFSSHQRDVELLARFQRSFENILDKHLPSRQKPAKVKRQRKVVLDARVLDLFVGLTHAPSPEVDVDEALTDLLYYVVDILQFNGEANAYDEIDFDSLVVETQDALQSYHEAYEATHNQQARHTILILDKQLHAFPWESLPCLDQRSVSRLSSLYDLRERILAMRQEPEALEPGYHIPIKTGTYILNPSGDLTKTQSRFEKPLSALHDWTSIIKQPPAEDAFLKALTPASAISPTSDSQSSSSLLLYFGHGSGAQYVRSRRIKRLRTQRQTNASPSVTCNTTLLFGCSSASLREVSEFEPYGTPKTYLAAGAPALLGSLWDVTDGDCDAFAGGVLERWGLLEKGACAQVESGKKKKGRAAAKKAKQMEEREEDEGEKGRKMCLSEAVARSRGECYLRYLNGAAMVVYGVPVFLAK